MKKKILVIGSAIVDIFITSRQFELERRGQDVFLCQRYGDKIELDRFLAFSGGGGSNVAVGLSRLDFSVDLISELGQDMWRDFIVQDLQKERVGLRYLVQEKKEQTGGAVIFTGADGGRTIMVHRGAASMLDDFDIPLAAFANRDWVHLTNLSGRQKTLQTIFDFVRKTQTTLSWNPGKQDLALINDGQLDASQLPAQILFLNRQEWQLVEKQHSLLRRAVPLIIITDGKKDIAVYQRDQESNFAPPTVTAREETGAGDAFATGVIAAQLSGLDLAASIAWGQKEAGSVIQHIGAKTGLLTKLD